MPKAAGHRCHAIACAASIPPAKFLCPRHWRILPAQLQRRIWKEYRAGQERTKRPSRAYVEVANAAIHWLHGYENRPGDLCVVCIEQGNAHASYRALL